MKKIKKILSLVLSASLIASYAPNVVSADNEGSNDIKKVTINVSAQSEYQFLVPYESITVAADKAESYGYDDNPIVEGGVTALDVLVAITEETYGEDFTKENKTDYLDVSYGFVTKAFGIDSYNFTFTINNEMPNDGVINEIYGTYTAYAWNQAVLEDGDYISIALLQDDSGMDYNVDITYNDKLLNDLTLPAGKEVTLNVTGYSKMWWGCYPDNIIEDNALENVEDVQLAFLDGYDYTYIEGAISDDNGDIQVTFDEPGEYLLTAVSEDEYIPIVMPVYSIRVAEEKEATIKDDIYLQYDFKELSIGEESKIYPRRVDQINKSDTTPVSYVVRPMFNFEIVSGDSIELSGTYSTDGVFAKAVKSGTTIVKVTYDACYAYGVSYAPIYEANTAYVVFDVPEVETDITIESGINYTSYDTIYFEDGDSVDYTFTPVVTGAESVKVTVNGDEVESENGNYTAKLKNRDNIIGIIATDANGDSKSFYQTVAARKIEIVIKNLTSDNDTFETGDQIEISFNGIALPVKKLAGIYNPTSYMPAWGGNASYVSYTLDDYEGVTYLDVKGKETECTDGEVKGYGTQYDITNTNAITLTFENEGDYTLSLGNIYSSWWGSGLGADKLVENGGSPNLEAPIFEGNFGSLPDITLTITESAEKKAERLENELAELQAKYDELVESYNTLKDKSDADKDEIESLITELASVKKELEDTAKELADTKEALEKATTPEGEKTDDNNQSSEGTGNTDGNGESGENVDNTNTSDETLKKILSVANSKVKSLKVKKKGKKAKLSWKKVTGADGYFVYRKVGKGKFKLIKTLKGENKVKFTNKKLKKKKYSYKVVAFVEVEGVKIKSKASKVKKIKIK